MINIESKGIILEKTERDFESQAVLNPACIEVNGITHMFYRAVRPGNFSSIGYCQIKDGRVLSRSQKPCLVPEYDYEAHGLEDPRVVFFEGKYYLFYTVYDGRNARIAYATSADLVHFEKQRLLSPQISYDQAGKIFRKVKLKDEYLYFQNLCQATNGKDVLLWDKNAFIFPRRINGLIALVHRILPDIQIAYAKSFEDFTQEYWLDYLSNLKKYIVLEPRLPFGRKIGGGCPPIETPDGWLLIYHSIADTLEGIVYYASAALLDLDDPTKVLASLPYPLFSPKEPWEKIGDFNNVVFPTGAVVKKGRLYIYYGAADRVIGVKSIELNALIGELKAVT